MATSNDSNIEGDDDVSALIVDNGAEDSPGSAADEATASDGASASDGTVDNDSAPDALVVDTDPANFPSSAAPKR